MLESSVSWLAFCVSGQLVKTIVHFFPSAGAMGAPYQALCSLTLLRSDFEPQTVMAEGARLGQPDGFRLDLAFPDFADSQPAALLIELSTSQTRLNLASSDCIIEFVSQFSTIKYRPKKLINSAVDIFPILELNDSELVTSLITVNVMDAAVRFPLQTLAEKNDPEISNFRELATLEIPAHCAKEFKLADFKTQQKPDCGVYIRSEYVGLAHYAIYRNRKTQQIVSVVRL
ncbi:MAG: hypothetical protein ACOX2O_05630 [Bdellovibrionota bacterium]|jgi:hypothetical protein